MSRFNRWHESIDRFRSISRRSDQHLLDLAGCRPSQSPCDWSHLIPGNAAQRCNAGAKTETQELQVVRYVDMCFLYHGRCCERNYWATACECMYVIGYYIYNILKWPYMIQWYLDQSFKLPARNTTWKPSFKELFRLQCRNCPEDTGATSRTPATPGPKLLVPDNWWFFRCF